MIFGTTLGESMPVPDIVADQTPSNAVKLLQQGLAQLSAITDDPDLDPNVYDGKVDLRTLYALFQAMEKGILEVPILGTAYKLITSMPGVSFAYDYIMDDRNHFAKAFHAVQYTQPQWLWDYMIEPVRSAANSVYTQITGKLAQIEEERPQEPQEGSFRPDLVYKPGMIDTVKPLYQPGTIGVHDPILGKYRLLVIV